MIEQDLAREGAQAEQTQTIDHKHRTLMSGKGAVLAYRFVINDVQCQLKRRYTPPLLAVSYFYILLSYACVVIIFSFTIFVC